MRGKGYLATFIGASIGGVALGWGGALLGLILELGGDSGDGLEGLIGLVYGGTVGGGIGVALGTWLALRWRRHTRAGATGAVLGVATPVALWGAFMGLNAAINSWFPRYATYMGPFDEQFTTDVVLGAAFLMAVIVGRFVVLRWPSAYRP